MKGSVRRNALLAAVSMLAILPGTAFAQEAAPPVGDQTSPNPVATQSSTGDVASDIVVTGTRASLENAEKVKRDSAVIVDGISADDISALPDASISDSLVRITGVNANDQVRGPNAISIRGLGPDLTLTTVNGRTLPTGSPGDRRLQLSTLPTEGISGAYIQKTPDAQTIEGGVAGVLDLRTIRPLENSRRGLTLVGRALFQDNSAKLSDARHFGNVGQRAEATYVGRLGDNIGIAATYAYLHQYSAFAGVQVDNYRLGTGNDVTAGGVVTRNRFDYNADGKPDALPTNVGTTFNFNDDVRHSFLGSVQWDVDQGVRATLDGLFLTDRNYIGPVRFFANNIYNGQALGPATSETVDASNTVQAFNGQVALYRGIYNEEREFDRTYGVGFNLTADHGPIKASLDISYFKSTNHDHTPQGTVENDAANAIGQRLPFSYDIADRNNVVLGFQPLVADDYALSALQDNFLNVSDEIKAARGDFTYTPDANSFLQSLAFGFRVDRRLHENRRDNTTYTFTAVPTRPDLDASYLQTAINPGRNVTSLIGGLSSATAPYFDVGKLLALRNAPGVTVNDQFGNDSANSFRVEEDTAALYAQANLRSGALSGNVGARYVIADVAVSGGSGTTPANLSTQTFNNTFRYWLPSANLRYDLTQNLLVRIAAAKTLSRQQFNDLQISSAVDLTTVPNGVLTVNRGNPNLKPFTSKGLDVSVEWSPRRSTNIAVAGYIKRVKNFLLPVSQLDNIALLDGTLVPAQFNTTINDPVEREIRGVEVNVRQDLRFLPGTLRNLGVQFNFNYNTTDIPQTSVSIINNVTAAGGTVNSPVGTVALGTQANVLPDQFSKFVFNGQVFYSTRRLDLRVAYRYFEPYFRAFFNSYQEQPGGQLDISGGLTLVPNLRLIGSVTNLLKERVHRYVPDYRDPGNEGITQLSVYQGRVATIGLRAHF